MGIRLRNIVLLGAVAWVVGAVLRGTRHARHHRHREGLLENGLEGTYPASDPVSTQDFSIPVNRQAGAA